MILSNLSTILGKKKLKIADLVKNTSITRPTLTALYYNTGKGINFDTLDALCSYLKTAPGEIFSFYDVDIEDIKLTYKDFTEDDYTVDAEYNSVTYISSADFDGYIKFRQKHLGKINFYGSISALNIKGDYTANIIWQCSRDFYFNIGPDDVLEYIDDRLHELLFDNYPHPINSMAIDSYRFTNS